MLLLKEIYFHFFTGLIKNSLGPQPQISVARWPGLSVEIAMVKFQLNSEVRKLHFVLHINCFNTNLIHRSYDLKWLTDLVILGFQEYIAAQVANPTIWHSDLHNSKYNDQQLTSLDNIRLFCTSKFSIMWHRSTRQKSRITQKSFVSNQ